MKRRLPARPNLEHLRTQAKALLAQLRDGDEQAARTFIEHLPEAASMTPQQVRERGFRLADAQAAVARKSGFAAWPALSRHVDRLRSMEGTWSFRSLEVDGNEVPAAMLTQSFILIDGDRFRMESPEANYEGIFTIDIEKTPQLIDIDFHEGPEAGNRCGGLFELEGDRFRICLGLAGSSRPKRFVTSPGSGHALEELVRVERSRPTGVDGGTPPEVTAPEPRPAVPTFDFETTLTETAQRLQGEWRAVSLINNGKALSESYLPFGSRTQTGMETRVVFGGQTMVHAKVRFDETSSPTEVDYLHLSGENQGLMSFGVFEWSGDEAVFCIAPPGDARPTDFTCDKGSRRTLSRWKRRS